MAEDEYYDKIFRHIINDYEKKSEKGDRLIDVKYEPYIGQKKINLWRLHLEVGRCGGWELATINRQWLNIARRLELVNDNCMNIELILRHVYLTYISDYVKYRVFSTPVPTTNLKLNSLKKKSSSPWKLDEQLNRMKSRRRSLAKRTDDDKTELFDLEEEDSLKPSDSNSSISSLPFSSITTTTVTTTTTITTEEEEQIFEMKPYRSVNVKELFGNTIFTNRLPLHRNTIIRSIPINSNGYEDIRSTPFEITNPGIYRMEKSLLSGLPNEFDFVMGVLAFMERVGQVVNLIESNLLISLLLAHLGVFQRLYIINVDDDNDNDEIYFNDNDNNNDDCENKDNFNEKFESFSSMDVIEERMEYLEDDENLRDLYEQWDMYRQRDFHTFWKYQLSDNKTVWNSFIPHLFNDQMMEDQEEEEEADDEMKRRYMNFSIENYRLANVLQSFLFISSDLNNCNEMCQHQTLITFLIFVCSVKCERCSNLAFRILVRLSETYILKFLTIYNERNLINLINHSIRQFQNDVEDSNWKVINSFKILVGIASDNLNMEFCDISSSLMLILKKLDMTFILNKLFLDCFHSPVYNEVIRFLYEITNDDSDMMLTPYLLNKINNLDGFVKHLLFLLKSIDFDFNWRYSNKIQTKQFRPIDLNNWNKMNDSMLRKKYDTLQNIGKRILVTQSKTASSIFQKKCDRAIEAAHFSELEWFNVDQNDGTSSIELTNPKLYSLMNNDSMNWKRCQWTNRNSSQCQIFLHNDLSTIYLHIISFHLPQTNNSSIVQCAWNYCKESVDEDSYFQHFYQYHNRRPSKLKEKPLFTSLDIYLYHQNYLSEIGLATHSIRLLTAYLIRNLTKHSLKFRKKISKYDLLLWDLSNLTYSLQEILHNVLSLIYEDFD
ncbi:hypothetical protein SNEBB_009953 [Seison nebaliae]|nr:hypothetical protein SNEBB_009953 [Seison nebaliae]